ncbi:MAG TPA: RecX family transcriptional regulator [Terriglobales bacterium]|nr:RecX family transcriptional regulator [Terriglobales bacterium]
MAGRADKLDEEGLYAKAVGALARRERSTAEVRKLLRPRAASSDGVEAALARLRDHGYLDDARMAAGRAWHQHEVEHHGRVRAMRDLRARGVSEGVAKSALDAVYGARPEAAREDRLLRAYVNKKKVKAPTDLKGAASLYRKLVMAGFSGEASRRFLKKWDWEE